MLRNKLRNPSDNHLLHLFLYAMKGNLLFLLMLLPVLLGAQTATLQIISDPTLKEPFFVAVNGVRQNESAAQNITIKGLPFEVYGIDVELATGGISTRNVVFLRLGKNVNYVLSKNGENLKLREGMGDEKPYNSQNLGINYKAVADPSLVGETVVEEYASLAAPPINFDDEPEEEHTDVPAKDPPQPKPDPEKLKFDADSMFRSIKERMNRQYQAKDQPCNGSLGNETFKTLKNNMREMKSLRDRYNLAFKEVEKTCITVGQLKDLMRLLDGDELKLEFYKDVYRNLIDSARRSDLFELFFFESSIEEIQKLD